jgi:hypothetical protein
MDTNNMEVRQLTVELRACDEDGKRCIQGRAIPFNVKSPNRQGFRELIAPEAVEGVIEASDIKMLYNHDESKGFLARSNKGKGKLNIEVKEDGVYFSFEPKKDNLSQYVYERLESGELNEMSWAFTVAEENWSKGEDGVYDRTITRFERLYDFSVVDSSYYGIENAVSCRSYQELLDKEAEELRIQKEKEEQERREQEEAQKAEQIKQYYANKKEELKDYL